jgi:hypothetical protein
LPSRKKKVIVKYVFLKGQYDPIRGIGAFWVAEAIRGKLSGRQPNEKLLKKGLKEIVPEEICYNNFFVKWRNYLVELKTKPSVEVFTLNYENYLAQWFSTKALPIDVFPAIPKTIKRFNLV